MTAESSSQTFAYAIKNPMVWINSSTWSSQDTSTAYMWHDKNVEVNSDGKSIFDPSPIGWRLPIHGVYSDLPANCTTVSDNVGTYTAGSVTANFYATGRRNGVTGGFYQVGSEASLWSSTLLNSTSGRNVRINTSTVTQNDANRHHAMAIRSVRE